MRNLNLEGKFGGNSLLEYTLISKELYHNTYKHYTCHPYPHYFEWGALEGTLFTQDVWDTIWDVIDCYTKPYYDIHIVLNQQFYTPTTILEWFS